jgi:hypothetical protein
MIVLVPVGNSGGKEGCPLTIVAAVPALTGSTFVPACLTFVAAKASKAVSILEKILIAAEGYTGRGPPKICRT